MISKRVQHVAQNEGGPHCGGPSRGQGAHSGGSTSTYSAEWPIGRYGNPRYSPKPRANTRRRPNVGTFRNKTRHLLTRVVAEMNQRRGTLLADHFEAGAQHDRPAGASVGRARSRSPAKARYAAPDANLPDQLGRCMLPSSLKHRQSYPVGCRASPHPKEVSSATERSSRRRLAR
jgi:hypothetical protein